jgi:hypothetical protein
MGFEGKVLEEQGIHRALQADVKLTYLALGPRVDHDADKGQLLEQGCGRDLFARQAVEPFGNNDAEFV